MMLSANLTRRSTFQWARLRVAELPNISGAVYVVNRFWGIINTLEFKCIMENSEDEILRIKKYHVNHVNPV